MGYTCHHSLVITGSFSAVVTARAKALELVAQAEAKLPLSLVSEILLADLNDVATCIIAPDGSNEGWPESDAGDAFRAAMIEWLRKAKKEDEIYVDWVLIQYGDDYGITYIVDHSDKAKETKDGEGAK